MTERTALPLSPHWSHAASAVLLLVAVQLVRNVLNPGGIDFVSYWAAARLLLSGTPALAYDIAAHHAVEARVADMAGLMSFPYPPPFLFVVAPFGLLPFPLAAIAWVGVSAALLAVIVRRFHPHAVGVALAFPPLLVCGIIGQNGLFSAALMVAGSALLGRRSFIAGLLFGALAMKPHLAAAVPILLLAMRDWRALAGAAAAFAGLCLASLIVFGIDPWRGFFGILPFYSQIAAQGGIGWHRVGSIYAALRLAGLPALPALTLHASVAIAALWLVWRTGRVAKLAPERGAALSVATALLSPYAYMYDQVLLIVAIVWLLRQSGGERAAMHVILMSLLAYVLMVAEAPVLNLVPLAPLALLWHLYSRTGEARRLANLMTGARVAYVDLRLRRHGVAGGQSHTIHMRRCGGEPCRCATVEHLQCSDESC